MSPHPAREDGLVGQLRRQWRKATYMAHQERSTRGAVWQPAGELETDVRRMRKRVGHVGRAAEEEMGDWRPVVGEDMRRGDGIDALGVGRGRVVVDEQGKRLWPGCGGTEALSRASCHQTLSGRSPGSCVSAAELTRAPRKEGGPMGSSLFRKVVPAAADGSPSHRQLVLKYPPPDGRPPLSPHRHAPLSPLRLPLSYTSSTRAITPLSSLSSTATMTPSPQPAPAAASRSPHQSPPSAPSAPPPALPLNGSSSTSSSPAQLASLLTNSLRENESLKHDLVTANRRADKAEQLLTKITEATSAAPSSPPHPAQPNGSSSPNAHTQFPPAALKLIVEFETRAERAEQARDEAEARLRVLQDSWAEMDRWLALAECRSATARAEFNNIVTSGGGSLVAVPPSFLATHQLPPQQPLVRQPVPIVLRSTAQRAPGTQTFPSLPPPPSTSSTSRVRPRSGSLDAADYPSLTGPGAPPPSKRQKSDCDRDQRHYSVSPSHTPYLNGQSDRESLNLPALQPYYSAPTHIHPPYRPREDIQTRYIDPSGRYPPHQSHARHRGRPTSRGRSSRSRTHSRGSSMSLDEMLIEATTGNDHAQHPEHMHEHERAVVSHVRSHSRERREYLGIPHSHSHSRTRASPNIHAHAQLHPSAAASGPGVSPPGGAGSPPQGGSHAVGGQVQTYQTHIFAPPVTGAPVKKTKTLCSLSGQGSVLTLGPSGGVIAGPSAVGGGGGFPPTNASGQRICRQCGLPGRYKEGKCVEKWGPGPEGPGTVCDRCRKKMKRVERRGTLEGQALANHHSQHHAPAAIHPSSSHQLTNGRSHGSSSASDRSLHRSDTVIVSMPSRNGTTLGPTGTHIIDPTYTESHVRNGSHQRAPPTPPYIATLPGSSVDEEGAYNGRTRRETNGRNSARASTESATPPAQRVTNGNSAAPSVRDGDFMDVDGDADGDADADADADAEADVDAEAEADGDGEGDVQAELLEAVDAAEANADEWMKKED